MAIPQDPFMLVSMLNMKLRDGNYEDLSDLLATLDLDEDEVLRKLSEVGFEYDKELKRFR